MMMNEHEVEQHKQQCLERWRKYWRLAQAIAALPSRIERKAAVEKHSADYQWFPGMVKQAWTARKNMTREDAWCGPGDERRPHCPVCGSHHVHETNGLHWCDVCGCEREVPVDDDDEAEVVWW